MANEQANRRPSREPIESEDPVFVSGRGSPTFMRRDLARTGSIKATESNSSPDPNIGAKSDSANVKDLPGLIDKVDLKESSSFPPKDFVGDKEGTPVDYTDYTPTTSDTPRKSVPTENSDSNSISTVDTLSSSDTSTNAKLASESQPTQTSVFSPQPKLRRKSSSLEVKTITLPKVNCPEKIFLCVDHSEELFQNKFQTQSANQTCVFKTLTNALKQFVCTKSYLNKKHQFSLVMLNDDAQLITDFSPNYEDLLYMLNDIASTPMPSKAMNQQNKDSVFDLTDMFSVVKQHAGLPRLNMKQAAKMPPPYIVRVIFIYGRSNSRPKFLEGPKSFALLNNSPFFFIDCVYIHEESTESNNVESIFSDICSLDIRGTSHIHEVGTDSNMACLYNILAKLLAHPLQRPKQTEDSISYKLEAEQN